MNLLILYVMNTRRNILYKYEYVKAKARGLLSQDNHREIINQYSTEGWRFVTAIPLPAGNQVISEFDLIFEKEINTEQK